MQILILNSCVILYAPNTSALTIELMESPDSPMYQTYFPRTPENYTGINFVYFRYFNCYLFNLHALINFY